MSKVDGSEIFYAHQPEQIKDILNQRHPRNNDMLIYHHLGMGDHIALSGLVREIIKDSGADNVYIACLTHNMQNVSRLFADLENVGLIDAGRSLGGHRIPVMNWIKNNGPARIIEIGHTDWSRLEGSWEGYVDTKVYRASGYDVRLRWDNFKYERDLDAEEEVFKKLNPNDEEYCFVHDPGQNQHIADGNWRGSITDETVRHASTRSNLKIIRNDPNVPMLDMGLFLERASELHLMESSIRCLVEGLDTLNTRHFHHRYIRDSYCLDNGTMKSWMVIEEPDPKNFKTSILNGAAQIEYFKKHGEFSTNLRATGLYQATWVG